MKQRQRGANYGMSVVKAISFFMFTWNVTKFESLTGVPKKCSLQLGDDCFISSLVMIWHA